MAKTGTIPIGLFRGVFPQMKVGPKQNKMSYVYTNPTKDTELFSCDKVFVLTPHIVGSKIKVSRLHDWNWCMFILYFMVFDVDRNLSEIYNLQKKN